MDISVSCFEADSDWRDRVSEEFGEKAARHLHFEEGFTILAAQENQLVGMISVYWRMMPKPLVDSREGYIDIIEIVPEYRRHGIASQLIHRAVERASVFDVYQMRAWSSEDKHAAISMWQTLGFGLVPAVVFHGSKEIQGFYAVKVLESSA